MTQQYREAKWKRYLIVINRAEYQITAESNNGALMQCVEAWPTEKIDPNIHHYTIKDEVGKSGRIYRMQLLPKYCP